MGQEQAAASRGVADEIARLRARFPSAAYFISGFSDGRPLARVWASDDDGEPFGNGVSSTSAGDALQRARLDLEIAAAGGLPVSECLSQVRSFGGADQ